MNGVIGPPAAAARPGFDPSFSPAPQIRAAAVEFEALLVAQLLKMMRETGWSEREEDTAASQTYLEIAEQHLARAVAAAGGLGIAPLLERSLAGKPAAGTSRVSADKNLLRGASLAPSALGTLR